MKSAEVDQIEEGLDDDRRVANLARLHTVFRSALLHELRAPLNAVSLNLDLLRQSLEEGGTDEDHDSRVEYVRRVRSALDELEGTFASATRIRGLVEDGTTESDLVALVSDLNRTIRHEAFTRRLRLSWGAPAGGIVVRGAPSRLRQGMLNGALVMFDALPHGGEIVLSLREDPDGARFVLTGTGEAAELDPSDERITFVQQLLAREEARIEPSPRGSDRVELTFRFSGAR